MICRTMGNPCAIKAMYQHRRACVAAEFKVSNNPANDNTPPVAAKVKPIKIVAIRQ